MCWISWEKGQSEELFEDESILVRINTCKYVCIHFRGICLSSKGLYNDNRFHLVHVFEVHDSILILEVVPHGEHDVVL